MVRGAYSLVTLGRRNGARFQQFLCRFESVGANEHPNAADRRCQARVDAECLLVRDHGLDTSCVED